MIGIAMREFTKNVTVNNSGGIYWRADAEQDTSFTIARGNGRRVQNCDTYGQAVGRTGNLVCDVGWPDTEAIEPEQ